mgnify:CR=1 FL=1
MSDPTPLDLAAYELREAKAYEEDARNHRLECEQRLLALTGVKDEGAETHTTRYYKVTVTQSMTRTFTDDCQAFLTTLPNELFNSVVKLKPTLVTKGFKALADESPELYRALQAVLVTKTSKPSITVELIEPQE